MYINVGRKNNKPTNPPTQTKNLTHDLLKIRLEKSLLTLAFDTICYTRKEGKLAEVSKS